MKKRVIVVGGGIIGASIAYHLAKLGAEVTLLDAELKSGGMATANSWAWINASWGNDREYSQLRMRSMAEWRILDKQLPGLNVHWTGSLLWDLPEDKLKAFAQEHKSWGYDLRLVYPRDIKAIERHLREVPPLAVHAPTEGFVEPVHAVDRLIEGARQAGADVIHGAFIKYIDERNGRAVGVTTSEESFPADEVVVAAGAGSIKLLGTIGLKLKLDLPAGLLIHTKPAREILHGLVLTPKIHVRQSVDGHLIAGSDFGGSEPTDNPKAQALDLLSTLNECVQLDEPLKFGRYTIGYRPTPPDGLPLLGRVSKVPGLYLAVMHSGVTLAPVVGSIVSSEILGERRDEKLNRYLPERALA